MTDKLRAAAQALVARWDSPQWGGSAENLRHTGEYIAELRAALAEQPAEQEPFQPDWVNYRQGLRDGWTEGYEQGIADERTSEANIGIAGFDAKVHPARVNPYESTAPQSAKRVPLPHQLARAEMAANEEANEVNRLNKERAALVRDITTLCQWISETPHKHESVNQFAAYLLDKNRAAPPTKGQQ